MSANNKALIGLQKTYYITSPKLLIGLRARRGREEGIEREYGRGRR